MKCNDYEIINLCDIKKFNKKTDTFKDKSWTHITLSENFEIPINKPSINSISKIYLDAKIISTKIIKTPSSDTTNIEGLKLTGKLLLLSGIIYEDIVYISETIYNKLHFINLSIPFSTYIIVDENLDLNINSYCIYPCIEYIFVMPINKRFLNESINLFLFAHNSAKTPIPTPVSKLLTYFIFNSELDKEMLKIEFNSLTRTLIISSTGVFYASNPNSSSLAFNFELLSSDGSLKISKSIFKNQNGDNFKDTLDNLNFDFNDIINLTFIDKTKVILINYPDQNNNYSMISNSKQSFRITSNGIIPNILNNSIILNNPNNSPVIDLYLDIYNKKFLAISTGQITNPTGGENYFVMTLFQPNLKTIKQSIVINGNSNGDAFSNTFNDFTFDWGNVIRLQYVENKKIVITNYPDSSNPVYNPKANEENFSITINGLQGFVPIISIFSTLFILKASNTYNSNEELAKIEFNKLDMKLIVSSTGIPYSSIPNQTAFEFKLFASDGKTVKISKVIESNQNANDFQNVLNGIDFKIGDFIELIYLNSAKAVLVNYPDITDTYNMGQNTTTERFVITSNGITPILTPNKITVKSKDSSKVLTIQMVQGREIFVVSSTGAIPNKSSSEPYLIFILKNINGKDILRTYLNSNENGTSFKSKINNHSFIYEKDSLTLIYKDKTKIEISNYQNQGDIYIPTEDFNIFSIKSNQLIDRAFKSKIQILNYNDEEMSSIYFIKPLNIDKVIVVSTYTNAISTNSSQVNKTYVEYLQYYYLAIIDFNSILAGKSALSFSRHLDGTNITLNSDWSEVFRLSSLLNNKIIITNYKNKNQYIIGEEPEFLDIKQNSISSHPLNYSKIRVKNKNNSSILFIYFDNILYNSSNYIYLEPYSTEIINADSDFFSFKISGSNGQIRLNKQTLKKGETGNLIKVNIDPYNIFKAFYIGDILTLEYSNKDLIEIFDFPFIDPPYNPPEDSQQFRVTISGLAPLKLADTLITFRGMSDLELATIKFDGPRKKLLSFSTGTTAHNSFKDENYFTFILKGSNGAIKEKFSVKGNENANNFRDFLNEKSFNYNDIIIIKGIENERNSIFNYPNFDETTNLFLQEDSFIITPHGLISQYNYLKTEIILKSTNNKLLSRVRFNTNLKKLSVGSTRNSSSSNFLDTNYFSFILKDSNEIIKQKSSVKENESAIKFSSMLNDQSFEYNYTITLSYQDRNKVFLSNYPNDDESYTPLDKTEDFIINEDKVAPIIPPKPFDKLPNSFIFNAYSPNVEMAKIEFDKANYKLLVTSNGNPYNNSSVLTAFKFELLSSDEITIKNSAIIKGNETATNFKNILSGRVFQFDDLIKLEFDSILNLWLTNYPNQGTKYFMINNHHQGFKITQQGIVPYILPNIITLNNSNKQKIISIQFDILYRSLLVTSTNNIANQGSNSYFVVTLYNSTGIIQKQIANIAGNATGSTFNTKFNYMMFEYEDIIKLNYEEPLMIEITNFPTSRNPIYNPTGIEAYFKITKNGLEATNPLPPIEKLPNTFLFKTYDTEEDMASIEFDKNNKKLIVTSFANNCNSPSNLSVFDFELISSGTKVLNASINGQENANTFRNDLNGANFKYDDMIILTFSQKPKIILTNYPNQKNTYNMISHHKQSFKITTEGIIANTLPNSIILNNFDNKPVLIIQFDIYFKTFLVISTEETTNPGGENYFKTTQYPPIGTIEKRSYSMSGHSSAGTFVHIFLDTTFEFEDILKLECEEPEMIVITNFPTSSTLIYPLTEKTNWLKITPTGLKFTSPLNPPTILDSAIILRNSAGEEMFKIEFDITNKRLLATATDVIENSHPGNNLLNFILNSTYQILKFGETAQEFASNIVNTPFNFGDSFTLSYYASLNNLFRITNYQGQDFIPPSSGRVSFRIESTGLIEN